MTEDERHRQHLLSELWKYRRRCKSERAFAAIDSAIEEIELLQTEVWQLREQLEEYERERR